MPDTSNRSSETPTSMGGMRMSENVGPGASVKDIAKNMDFGVMGGMSLTQKKLEEKKRKEEDENRRREEEEAEYARLDEKKQQALYR